MADASPYESFEDDTSGPYESLEDENPHAAKLTPPGNFRQEGAYQGWLEMHALPQQPGRVTRDLEFPGTGYEKSQDADHTLSLGSDYNAVTHDLRGMWNKYATQDPVSGQMDLEPTAAQIDEFALPGMRGFTADSKFAKGVPANQLGSWNDDHTEYHPPGWQPESATSRIMQKASQAAGHTYDQVSAGLARGKQRNLADESMADQSLADQTLGDPLKIGAQNARQNLAVVGGQTGLLDPDTVADQIASAEKAKPPLPAFRRAADEQREKAGSFMGVLDSYIENPRATLATVMQGLSEGGVSLGLATGGGAAAGAVGGPVGAALGTAAGAGTGGYLDAYGSTILQTIKASGVDLSDKDAVSAALKDPALMAKAAAAGEKAGIPAAIINAVSFGVAGKLYAPAKALAGGGRLGTAAGIGAETAAQAGIGAGGEATRQAVQDDKMDIGRITEAGLSQVAPTLAFTALHARGAKPAPKAESAAEPEQPAGGFNIDDVKPQTGGPALSGSTASASDTYYPGYRWDPDAPNPQPGQPNRKGKYVPTGETAEAEAEPAAAARENEPQENNDLGETKALPAAARGEETPPLPTEPPVIDAEFQDLPPKAKAITLQATNPDAVTVEHTDSGSVVKVDDVVISTHETPEAAEQVAQGAREAIETEISKAQPETPLERTQPIQPERRSNIELRQRVNDMTPEQMRAALLQDDLTPLLSKRGWEERDERPTMIHMDLDSLKALNDQASYDAGNQLLKAAGHAIADEFGADHGARVGGDEFKADHDSPEAAHEAMNRLNQRLAGTKIEVTLPDGRKVNINGIGLSYGIGASDHEAETNLHAHKASREAAGTRSPRGELPKGTSITAPETGGASDESHAAAEEAGQKAHLTPEEWTAPTPTDRERGAVESVGETPPAEPEANRHLTPEEWTAPTGTDRERGAAEAVGETQTASGETPSIEPETKAPEPETEPAAAETKHPDLSEPESQFVETVGDRAAGRRNQEPVKDLREARSMYEQITGTKLTPASLKRVDELVERAIVETARSIVEEGDEPGVTYDRLVKLYERQPSLNTRTSTSIENQAYSTPAPLAYLASDLGGITHHTTVLEPTAGNGMLLIAADPAMATVNELNPERAASLEGQGFEVTRKNAVESVLGHDIDVLITNPPFGVVRDANGDSVSYQLTTPKGEPVKTNEIDHAIVLKQLEAMKGDGRAVLLIGGVNKLANTPEKRSDAYNGAAKRKFFYHLYQNYNVVDHFTVSGDMYSRQGAAWPIDMIVIHGVGKSALPLPAAAPPRVYASYPDLKGLLGKTYEPNRLDTGSETAGGADRGGRGVPEPKPDEANLPASSRGENPEHGASVARPPGGGEGTGASDVGGRAPAGHGELPAERGGNTPDHEQLGNRGEAHEPGRVPEIDESETPTGRELDGAPSPEGGSGRPDGAPEVVGESDGSGGVGAQEPYRAASKQNALGTLVPGNMRDSIRKSLDKLERDDGSADAFVAKEMGWPRADVGAKLAAEQVDALALAIKQIKAGKGFIIGDQCVSGSTRIYDPVTGGHTPIRYLAAAGQPITVLALTTLGLRSVPASAPFRKGVADLYNVTLDDGRQIAVTSHHRFLTPYGWQSIASHLRAGHFLACAEGRLACNLGFDPSIRAADDRNSTRTPQDSLANCRPWFHFDDELPHQAAEIDQGFSPSPADVPARTLLSLRRDGAAVSAEHSRRHQRTGLQPKNDFSPSESRALSLISGQSDACGELSSEPKHRNALPSVRSTKLPQPQSDEVLIHRHVNEAVGSSCEAGFCVSSSDDTGWRMISSITFVGQDEFFDMWVPNFENYVAEGFVNHNTGIGKGRVVASVIQWAINHGHTPIFMTEKPKLYGDMVRDLRDIGSKDIRPLMTNAGEKVPLSETDPGDVLKSPEAGRHNKVLQDAVNTARLADHNMVFTTYDQMNMKGGKQALRHELINTLAPNAILVLDESHNAGGTTAGRSNKKAGEEAGEKTGRAAFIRGLVGRSKGVFYSSATYAKRPDVMDLYFKTDMALAVSGDVSKLPGAIQAGGVPLQQVVASMLAESGQYIRRERSFNGVRYETPVSAVDRNAAEAISSMMLKVKEFDDLKQEAVKEAKKEAKREAKQVSEHGATGAAGAQSTNFTSLMHNLISQMLLALKADAAADHAIEALKRGEKPVITVSNTMGSFIGEYAEQAGLKTGDAIKLGFKDLMNRYLESSRRLIVKDHDGKTVSDRRISDEELGPSAVAAFNRAKKLIDGTREIQELPVSPIDWIHKRLREEGYKTGEITGRDDTIEYRKDGSAIYKLRGDKDKSTAAKTRDLGKFNNGGIDAMILNRSGSTGLSMHASEKFKDQRPRHMIIAQAEGNIDTHMQMLGRIFRTGQVELPIYSQLVADIPAEKRPAAILAKKMASLNANTTGARGSALTAKDSVDFLNDYGDEVVAQLMDDLPEIHEKLGEPLESSSTGGYDTDEAARKVTGRIPMLPVAEQEELYHLIESGYRERLAQADAMGENALEAKTLALDAKLVKKLTLTDGKKGESPFAEGSYAEVSDVKRVGKPFTSAEVRAQVADTLGMEGSPTLRQLTDRGQRVAQQTMQDVRAEYQKYRTAEEAKMLSNETKEAAMEGRLGALDGVAKRWMELANTVHVGGGYEFTMQDGSSLFGVVTEITRKKGVKMPTALGSWVAKIALADGSRQTQIPFSKMALESHGEATGKIKVAPASRNPRTGAPLEQMFDDGQSVSREQRVIVTGNLLAGYSTWKSGQIIHFTDNQGNVRQGILMPRSFKLEEAIENAPVKIPPAKAAQFLTAADRGLLKSTDGAVQIQRWGRGEFAMTVAKSKAEGGKYFLDPDLRRLTGDFVSQGSGMRAMLNEDQLRPALELIERKFDQKFETTSHRAEALAAGGEALGVKTGSDRLARGSTGGGMDRSDVERQAQAILDGFAVKPKGLVVVQSPQELLRTDLGPNMRSAVEGGGNPIAAYYPGTGKIYIVADAIKSPEHLAGIMAHEMVVHFGLRSMLGSPYSAEYRQLLRNIATALPAATDYHGRREIPNYDPNRKSHKQIGAEEALAYYEQAQAQGGTIPPAWKQWIDKLHQIVRDWLRKIAGLPEKFDDLYVRNVLNALRQHLRTGKDRSTAEGEASNAMPKDTFYSSVERAVDAAKRDKGTGAEWEATLRNMPGVKQEEMEWLGLKDWLQGRGRVSKQEVADYVRAHRIELGEHVLGMGGTDNTGHLTKVWEWMEENADPDEVDNSMDGIERRQELLADAAQGDPRAIGLLEIQGVPAQLLAPFYDLSNTVPPMRAEDIETLNQRLIDKLGEGLHPDQMAIARQGGAALADMLESIENRMGVDLTGIRVPTQEQIDGAPKYGEYTAPGGKNYREMLLTLPPKKPSFEIDDFINEMSAKYGQPNEEHVSWSDTDLTSDELAKLRRLQAATRTEMNANPVYQSNHFDQPNVLVHARFDERQLPTGERTLHIAEIQSDWHHEGWQHGYKPDRSPIVAAKAEWVGKPEDEGKRRGYWVVSDANGNFIRNAMDEPYSTPTSRPLARTAQEAIDQTNKFLSENTGYDPNIVTSDQKVPDAPFKTTWQELALKRLLRYAVDKGFDALSWDTGQTVADRFSLRKQIDSLAYNGRDFVAFGKNGEQVHRQTGASQADIERLVGKEIAQRLMDAPPENGVRTLDGVNLDIGAEGKQAIYDKMLPTKMNKLVGKWGGKVERGEVAGHLLEVEDHPFIPAHIVRITPEMRNSVLEGMPLFARPMFARDGDPPPPYEEPRTPSKVYMAARRAATMMVDNRLVMDIRRLLNPKDVSAVSKEVAARTIPYLGELAHMKAQAQEHLEQFARAIGKLSPQDQLDMIHAIETGQRQPIAALQPAADAMRQMLDFWRDQVRALGDGYLENYIENYFPHFWQDKASDVEKMFASIQGRRTMRGPATFLKQRVVPTIRDGIEWGLKPATINPLVMTLLKVHEMQRFISGVTMMRSYKEHGLAVFQRADKQIPAGWVKVDDPIARVSQWSEEEQGFINRGHYIMPEDGGRIINNHLSASRLRNFAPAQAFKFATNLLNSMQLGLSAFHLGFTTLDAMVSKNALAIEHMMHFEPLRAASAFLEAATPAGAIMNVRRGYQLMQAYLNPSGATPELRMLVNGLIAGGGRVKMDTYFLPTHGQSPFRGYGPSAIRADVRAALAQPHDKVSALTKAIGNIPVEYAQKMWNELRVLARIHPKLVLPFEILGRITRATTAPIMEYIVPYQKLGVFSDLASNWIRRNPGADAEDVAKAMQAIWRSVDNRLGEMVYDNKFWDRTFKDALHLDIRAVGWNFGTIEEIGGAPHDVLRLVDQGIRTGKITADDVGHKIPYVLGLMFTTALMGAITTYLMTGKGPDELKDYIFPKTGRLLPDGSAERISLPSYAKDIWEYAHHPGTTLIHKANPIFGEISDQWNGTDYFGHPIYNPSDKSTVFDWHTEDRARHFFGEALPFSIQGQKQLQGAKEPGFIGEAFSAMPFVGLAPAPGVVTNPEKIESFQHYKELQAWKDKLKYDLKQAQKAGDKAKVQDIQRQLQESRRENAQEHSEYMRRKMEAQKRIQEQKRSGNTSDLLRTIGPLIDGAGSRAEMQQRVEKAGYPALAGLLGSLPDTLRPQVRAKLAEYA